MKIHLMKNAKTFIEDGMHPTIIIRAIRKATAMAIKKIKEILGYIEAFEEQKNENIEFIVGTRGTNCLQEMKYTVR